jgi:hypothetical protein
VDTTRLLDILEICESGAAVLVAARLIHLRLARTFPAMFGWLTLLALSDTAFLLLGARSTGYFAVYNASVIVQCIFNVLVVRELFSIVFRDYPGISSVGRWATYGGVGLAVAGSLLLSIMFRHSGDHGSTFLSFIEVANRSIVFGLTIVIATILFVLSRYPLNLNRNIYVSSSFFSALLLAEAARLLLDNLTPYLFNLAIDESEAGFSAICLIGWAFFLQSSPHSARQSAPPPSRHDDQLLRQLTALNQLLGRTVRQ